MEIVAGTILYAVTKKYATIGQRLKFRFDSLHIIISQLQVKEVMYGTPIKQYVRLIMNTIIDNSEHIDY